MPTSVFSKYAEKAWPYRYAARLEVDQLVGGTPRDPKVAEAWLRKNLGASTDELILRMTAEVIEARALALQGAGVDDGSPLALTDEDVALVNELRHLNGFKADKTGLYIEGRQAKSMLKEAAMVCANAGKLPATGWGKPSDGNYKKGLKAWFPEHVFVPEDRLPISRSSDDKTLAPVTEFSRINQRFSHTSRGAAIQYEEIVEQAVLDLTVVTDHLFTDHQWAMIWLTAEQLGIGATRSQGYGRFVLTRWERLK